MKKLLAFCVLASSAVVLFGCNSGPADEPAPEGDAPQQVEAPKDMPPPEERGAMNDGG